uniref:Uncharacterized protein n=1 Tax=Callorhinchus milii TaxID=7868 RepID=A0A4W3GS12_CALMI
MYALLGAGIGLFLVISFVLIKVYMIKKHIFENEFSGKVFLRDTRQARFNLLFFQANPRTLSSPSQQNVF